MCLIVFAYKAHPKYKLIVAANRDEAYGRPTAAAHFWDDRPDILAGRDLEKMGTWMGVTSSGRFAALTNYRNPSENTEGKKTRGELVANFLSAAERGDEYLERAAASRYEYSGYNLLAGDVNELFYYSNVGNSLKKIEPGVHGVSNHLLNTAWPKVEQGKEGLARIIADDHPDMVNQLFSHLESSDPAPDHLLPATGVPLEWERLLSPIFIKSEGYGTRSSTVILMNDEEIFFKERVYNGGNRADQEFKIKL
ncbi:MAG: NRDE family protein [Mesobacillus sp.]|uniref:NRDE family protein n=1 Tax=Mesobacillus sp. TaxID=2675271 RepID=UPI003C536155